jgi:hypothetical protein
VGTWKLGGEALGAWMDYIDAHMKNQDAHLLHVKCVERLEK